VQKILNCLCVCVALSYCTFPPFSLQISSLAAYFSFARCLILPSCCFTCFCTYMGYNTKACSCLVHWGWCFHGLCGSRSHSLQIRPLVTRLWQAPHLLKRLLVTDIILAINIKNITHYLLNTVNSTSKSQLEQTILGSLTVQIWLLVSKVGLNSYALHMCINKLKVSTQIT
jgi:hypothetical protein